MTTEPERGDDPSPSALLSARLIAAVVVTILVLLVIVVIVGLARDNLDSTGVATVLSTLFSGIVLGALVKGRGDGSRGGPS